MAINQLVSLEIVYIGLQLIYIWLPHWASTSEFDSSQLYADRAIFKDLPVNKHMIVRSQTKQYKEVVNIWNVHRYQTFYYSKDQ